MSDEKQRAAMAAHLFDLGGHRARRGEPHDVTAKIARAACYVLSVDNVADEYRRGLDFAGLAPEQIDAAVSTIERGEEPADSLVGQVRKMRKTSLFNADGNAIAARGYRHEGEAHAFNAVLALLGVTP